VKPRFLNLCWVCRARILALMMLLLLAAKAFAEPVEAPPPPLVPPEDTPLTDGTRERTPPDYRGQKSPPTTTGDVLIWGPRVILFPAYLVTEYLVRAPVGGLATVAEKDNWGPSVFNFFAFGPDHKYGIFPVFSFNYGFRPSVGAHFFWDDAVVKGNNFATDVAYGGTDWITVGIGDRYNFSKNNWLTVAMHWKRRPDALFYGIGYDVSDNFKSRWASDEVEGSVSYTQVIHHVLRIDTKARIYRTVFRDYTCCNDPTIQQQVDAGDYAAPPGYGENTTAAELALKVVLDSRPPIGNRSGFRVGVEGAPGVDVTRGFDRSWIHYGGVIEGSWDVTKSGRVLSLGVFTAFADPLGSQPVPFYELVTVGGAEPFTGFLKGRLRDRSAIAAELSWRWPVFAYLDGVAAVGVGNVFAEHLNNFRFERLRFNAELGIRTAAALGASNFQLIAGIGSEPFEQGFRITSFSLSFGVTYAL
jgi:hypothetical protein